MFESIFVHFQKYGTDSLRCYAHTNEFEILYSLMTKIGPTDRTDHNPKNPGGGGGLGGITGLEAKSWAWRNYCCHQMHIPDKRTKRQKERDQKMELWSMLDKIIHENKLRKFSHNY